MKPVFRWATPFVMHVFAAKNFASSWELWGRRPRDDIAGDQRIVAGESTAWPEQRRRTCANLLATHRPATSAVPGAGDRNLPSARRAAFCERAAHRRRHCVACRQMAAASSSISAAPGLPLLSLDPQCPVLVIVDTRKPINQGFGARVTFIAWAADVARKLGAQLAIDEHFWASGHMKQYHYGHSFPWAWDLFPFLKAGEAIKGRCRGRCRGERTNR